MGLSKTRLFCLTMSAVMNSIHQFVAGFSNGDAISNEALVMRRLFRSWGFRSEIFSESKRILPELRKQAHDVAQFPATAKQEDIVLLHLSIGSVVNELFAALPCRKAILYHNATPAHYFELINNKTARHLTGGRAQIKSLSNAATVNIADSRFNANELEELGYKDVKVLPLLLDIEKLREQPDRKILRKFKNNQVNILFVGRCAPNKRIEDALKAFYYFHKFVEPNSRFIHVGSFAGTERYYYLLRTQTRELGIDGAVHFSGSVPQSQLNAFYECAQLFLCMSEHEGFCIPVLESMVHDVPVLAYAAAAVPEIMDGAGVLFHDKRFDMISEMMGRMVRDNGFRSAIINGQQERLARYTRRDLALELKQHLAPLLG